MIQGIPLNVVNTDLAVELTSPLAARVNNLYRFSCGSEWSYYCACSFKHKSTMDINRFVLCSTPGD
jgi:hypothetical protein